MKNVLIGFAFVVLLPQALGIHCLVCYSTTSWADCEKKLRYSYDCHATVEADWVCMTQSLTQTIEGKTLTHYSKMCSERKHCDPKTCNRPSTTCEVDCCCEDNCNVGIPGEGVSKASLLSSCTHITVLLVLSMYFITC